MTAENIYYRIGIVNVTTVQTFSLGMKKCAFTLGYKSAQQGSSMMIIYCIVTIVTEQ